MQSQIFLPNNHSKWQIAYREVAPEVNQEIIEVFLKHYGEQGDRILSVEQVDETEINSNNFKVTFVRAGMNRVILIRRYGEKRDKALLEATASVLDHLQAKRVRAPKILRSNEENTFEREGAYTYTAFEFLDGNHYRGTLPEIASVAHELAKLHDSLVDVPNKEALGKAVAFPQATLDLRIYDEDIWERIFLAAKQTDTARGDAEFDARLLSHEGLLRDALMSTAPDMYADTERSLVHFDLHPHNILTDGTELLAIIDLDSLRMLEPMRAVAFSLHRLVRQYIVHMAPEDIDNATKEATRAFLDAYSEVKPLTSGELESIPYFIRNEALSRLSYAMKDYYFNGNPAWKGDLDKQTATIAEAKYFEL